MIWWGGISTRDEPITQAHRKLIGKFCTFPIAFVREIYAGTEVEYKQR